MNNTDFINAYIEKLLIEISELTKTRILLQTQLTFNEKISNTLQARVTELEDINAQLEDKLQKAKSKKLPAD